MVQTKKFEQTFMMDGEQKTAQDTPGERQLRPAAELNERVIDFFNGYYLIGARRDRESFYALTADDMKDKYGCFCGLFLNYVMDGELDKAWELIEGLGDDNWLHHTLVLVFPGVSAGLFLSALGRLKKMDYHVNSVILTAGRPTIINGVMDFTRLAPFLKKEKNLFIEGISHIYDPSIAPATYELGLAEWYYQQDMLPEADLHVSNVIQDFDNDSQRRLLFVALYLKTKIAFANGKVTDPLGYIQNIRRFVREAGAQEFSYNIDAAEAYTALGCGNYEVAFRWLSVDAPDEFTDFNMLDLYRYMIKMRCYIVNKRYMSVVALGEKLRPLLERGKRRMDLCEIDLLLAICYYRSDETELALMTLERVLRIARRRGYFRLIADEGAALLPLLVEYVKAKGRTPYMKSLLSRTRDLAGNYPVYLKPVNKDGVVLSKIELTVLKFLEQGRNVEEMAKYFLVSDNTIKFHMKNIYKKLGVNTACQAVWEARTLGII